MYWKSTKCSVVHVFQNSQIDKFLLSCQIVRDDTTVRFSLNSEVVILNAENCKCINQGFECIALELIQFVYGRQFHIHNFIFCIASCLILIVKTFNVIVLLSSCAVTLYAQSLSTLENVLSTFICGVVAVAVRIFQFQCRFDEQQVSYRTKNTRKLLLFMRETI